MSNKAVSVYADALKRQREEQHQLPSTPWPDTQPISEAHPQHTPPAPILPQISQQVPVFNTQNSQSQPEATPFKPHGKSDHNTYRDHDSKLASPLSSYHDSSIQFLRNAVRFSGKEAFFGRFTPEEKALLKDIAYTY